MSKPVCVAIIPHAYTTEVEYTGFCVLAVVVKVGVSAVIKVGLYVGANLVSTQSVDLVGSDYQAWGTDDSYIQDFAMRKLGFSLLAVTSTSSSSVPMKTA